MDDQTTTNDSAGTANGKSSEKVASNLRFFRPRVIEELPRLRRISLADLTRVATLVAHYEPD